MPAPREDNQPGPGALGLDVKVQINKESIHRHGSRTPRGGLTVGRAAINLWVSGNVGLPADERAVKIAVICLQQLPQREESAGE